MKDHLSFKSILFSEPFPFNIPCKCTPYQDHLSFNYSLDCKSFFFFFFFKGGLKNRIHNTIQYLKIFISSQSTNYRYKWCHIFHGTWTVDATYWKFGCLQGITTNDAYKPSLQVMHHILTWDISRSAHFVIPLEANYCDWWPALKPVWEANILTHLFRFFSR